MKNQRRSLQLWVCALIAMSISYCAHAEVNKDSLNEEFQKQIKHALAFQKHYERIKLDSVLDIAIAQVKAIGSKKNLAYCYYLKSDALSQSEPLKSIEYADKAFEFYEQEGSPKMLSVILVNKGNSQSNIGAQREAIKTYEQAIRYSHNSPGSDEPAEQHKRLVMRYSIGMTQMEIGDLIQAAENIHRVYSEAKKADNKSVLIAAIHQLGNLSLARNELEDALSIFREGLQLSRKDFQSAIAVSLSGLASAFMLMNELDSANYYAKEALEINLANKNYRGASANLSNLAQNYIQVGNFKQAITYNRQLLELSAKSGMTNRILSAKTAMCTCYLEMGNTKKADTYATEVLDQVSSINQFPLLVRLYDCLARLSYKKGQFKRAFEYKQIHHQYADTVLNQASNEKMDLLHVEYQTNQKEEKIQQLELEQEIDQLANKQRLLYLSLIGIFTLGILGSLLFISHRRKILFEKQKENIEQRLLRSQMNPHFIFNAISSIQNYLFDEKDQKTALQYLSHFSELMRQILENSREPYISLSDEISALSNYLKLQLLRYNQEFRFEINVAPNLNTDELMVPPLILQPFVENAIEHGKIHLFEDGMVQIDIKLEGEYLSVDIIDNGKGFDKDNLTTKTNKSKSLGTQITKERLEYLSKLFNKKFEIAFLDNLERGSQVHLTLPKVSYS